MMRGVLRVILAAAAVLVLGPAAALAQEGQIAGTVRDTSGALMPGVTVEVTSPALIEKVRTATTDASGQYRITNLPVGTYKVTFTLEGFTKQERDDVVLTSGFTAPVNGTLERRPARRNGGRLRRDTDRRRAERARGDLVPGRASSRSCRRAATSTACSTLTPGISSNYRPTTAFGAPGVCVGGIGVFCNPGLAGFNVGDTDDQPTCSRAACWWTAR